MLKVLLVDDEKDICLLLSGILEKEGFKTTYALNMEDAKNKLAADQYGAAFIDLNLPDGVGSQLIPIIKDINNETKVIIISAYDQGLSKASSAGADYLIKKPFSRSVVLSALNDLHLNN